MTRGHCRTFVFTNFRTALLEAGRFDEAAEMQVRQERLKRDPVQIERSRVEASGLLHFYRRE